MKKETVYRVVSVDDVLSETKDFSIPIINNKGSVNQMRPLDCNKLNREKYNALKPSIGYFHTSEELAVQYRKVWEAATKWQRAESAEFHGGPENENPNRKTFIDNLFYGESSLSKESRGIFNEGDQG